MMPLAAALRHGFKHRDLKHCKHALPTSRLLAEHFQIQSEDASACLCLPLVFCLSIPSRPVWSAEHALELGLWPQGASPSAI